MGAVESNRASRRERIRAAQEKALRRRKASVILGLTGLSALFAGGIATLIFPGAIVALTVLMAIGVGFLILAFSLAGTRGIGSLRALEK